MQVASLTLQDYVVGGRVGFFARPPAVLADASAVPLQHFLLALCPAAAVHFECKERVRGGSQCLLPGMLAPGETLSLLLCANFTPGPQGPTLFASGDHHVPLPQGDTSNLLGCILAANQLPTQVYTAVYFIIIDMCGTRHECRMLNRACYSVANALSVWLSLLSHAQVHDGAVRVLSRFGAAQTED